MCQATNFQKVEQPSQLLYLLHTNLHGGPRIPRFGTKTVKCLTNWQHKGVVYLKIVVAMKGLKTLSMIKYRSNNLTTEQDPLMS